MEESLISRDTLPGMCQLKFGQGMKRGLSVKLVRLGRILLNACHCQVQCFSSIPDSVFLSTG